ncbi:MULTISPECIES: alpha-ketoacid dehydrogenase subunit beta [unclassified Polynucleobacter]|uniref:alpha-ketoacid dehydrogenase subunit beta n=1 Tax=unclassified Polynucleobacter TaxID=2640945 RepID=UPI0008ACD2F4|nr:MULTISPECIES: alpha-ketoacid dehydrogenase subunit beta [unclassified Polynucleobacter]OHC09843.1 MAG: acetoin dehydrogenase [Polynucleobacter sp. GWA2_45_21]HBK42805.1 alpha-ketoacid dehydrogenase subunit beta [Polynucleobacter sp.]
MRYLKYFEAIREATDQAMMDDPSVFLVGLGVPDPKGIFGTTLGLQEKYGEARVQDMPLSENAMTGVALGMAISGMRPILSHQRVDFTLVAIEQMVNQAAKWHFMFGGQVNVPLVIRMIIGRGWGQGPQHSQSLQAWFAHIPGLKVLMPTTAYDAKGLMMSAIADNNPVIILEHRWLYAIPDAVPEDQYLVPIGKARVVKEGSDVTIVSSSYMTLESLKAGEYLSQMGVSVEVVDLRSIKPWDVDCVLSSVKKTGRLLVADTGGIEFGISAEIIATISELAFSDLKKSPSRIGLPNYPCPTSPALAENYYPDFESIIKSVERLCDFKFDYSKLNLNKNSEHRDVPYSAFTGPF